MEERTSVVTLLNAPDYNPANDERNRKIFIGAAVTIALLAVLAVAGFVAGHGWLFSNLPYEHRVNDFFDALEARDYAKAYGIYNADPDWQQHPQKYTDYPLQRFTEDWTTQSPVKAPITNHHVDISRTDGSGTFGTGVIVAVRINGDHPIFMYVNRKDKTMTWPAIHELQYKYNP
jgi:hypothetical protein